MGVAPALLGLILLLAVACGGDAAPARTEAEARKIAADAAAALLNELVTKLTTAMSEGPPEHALQVCGDVAQDVTARVREEQGVFLHRTSHRLRNPENAPDAWEEKWLARAQARNDIAPEGEVEVVALPDGKRELRFVRALTTQEICLKCHGAPETLRPQVRALLKERYPEDRATGFRAGDLRGIVSVRVPLE